jgi:preprotein translocase subunit SecG
MEQLILVAHLLVAFAIISLILLQQGKGADMGASFGAGGSQTLFGSDGGGNVLTRATAFLVTAFFVTSFGLAIVAKDRASGDVELSIPVPLVEQTQPVMESDLPPVDNELPTVVTDPDAAADLPELPDGE